MMNNSQNTSCFIIPGLIISLYILIILLNHPSLPGGSIWIKYFVIGFVTLAMHLQFIRQNGAGKKQSEMKRMETHIKFEEHYDEARKRYSDDENVTFDHSYIHIRLKDEVVPLLQLSPPHTELLLLIQKDYLQVTCTLETFRQHLTFLKASRKYSTNNHLLEMPEKIGLGLWQFKKEKTPALFPVFIRKQITTGNIHIWNIDSKMYETEMMNSEIKTFEGNFITQFDNYSCGGIEFFKYPSCFY